MSYRDIVEMIKINQIKQGISVKVLAERIGVSAQVLTDIRGYRLKVSAPLFDSILRELGITDLTDVEKENLLKHQERAQLNKHRKYEKEKNRKLVNRKKDLF